MTLHTRRMVVALSIALGLLVLACGSTPASTTAPTAQQPPQPAAIGDKTTGDGYTLTVAGVERKQELSDFEKAKDGNTYVVADVLVEATDKASYNLLYFKVKDASGVEYNPSVATLPDVFKSGELVAGDKARGKVVFEVPTSATGLVLSYKPLVIGSGDGVRVKLD